MNLTENVFLFLFSSPSSGHPMYVKFSHMWYMARFVVEGGHPKDIH